MGTWILETDKAIYWMEDKYYIDKIDKTPSANGGYEAGISDMKDWFSTENPPGMMRIVRGNVTEPTHKPINGDSGHGSGHADKPTVQWVAAAQANFNSRNGTQIDMIIMHNTDASLQASINTFKDPNAQVSAHYIVARSGNIIQMVQDTDRAFHAGNRTVNARSIGIEHEATEAHQGLTAAQEKSSVALIKYLMAAYDISLKNIQSHRDVDTIPGGTDCPHWIWPSDNDLEAWKKAHLT